MLRSVAGSRPSGCRRRGGSRRHSPFLHGICSHLSFSLGSTGATSGLLGVFPPFVKSERKTGFGLMGSPVLSLSYRDAVAPVPGHRGGDGSKLRFSPPRKSAAGTVGSRRKMTLVSLPGAPPPPFHAQLAHRSKVPGESRVARPRKKSPGRSVVGRYGLPDLPWGPGSAPGAGQAPPASKAGGTVPSPVTCNGPVRECAVYRGYAVSTTPLPLTLGF